MEKLIYIILAFILSFSQTANAQTVQKQKNQPDIKIDVNVQRDENGNIIGYDSTYVETWSSDGTNIDTDSLMQMFKQEFTEFNDFAGFGFNNDDFFVPGFDFGFPQSFSNDSLNQDPFAQFFAIPDINDLHKQMMEEMKRMEQMFQPNCAPAPILPPPTQNNNTKPKVKKTSYPSVKI